MPSVRRLLTGESKTITGAAILIGASSLASRVLGVLRERLLVGHFGVGNALDAYYASFEPPNFLYNLLILGTLSVAFIPIFVERYDKDREDAWRVAASVLNATALVMGAAALALFAFAPQFVRLVAPGFAGAKLAETASLTRIMAVSPFLFALSSVWGSVLNARRHFLTLALAPLVYNLSIILGILVLAPAWGIRGVAIGVVVGAALHAGLQLASALLLGFRFRGGLRLRHPGVRETWRLFFPRIWGIDISQLSTLIGTVIGSTLAVGSVALFNLSTNVQTVPVGVFGVPFAIAAFPTLAAALARGDRRAFLDTFSRTARQVLFFLLPLGAMTVVLRAHVIRLVIGTAKLSWDDTRLAAAALAFFAASMFLQGLTPLLSRAFYALKNTWIPVTVSGVAVAANVALSYAFLAFLGRDGAPVAALVAALRLQGVPDIRMLALPLAFSAASLVQTTLLATVLRAKYGAIDGRRIAFSAAKTVAASAVALVATRLGLSLAALAVSDRTFLGILAQTLVASAIGIGAFLGAATLLGSEEAAVFFASTRRRMLRASGGMSVGDATDMRS